MSPRRATNRRRERSAPASQLPSGHGGWRSRSPRPPDSRANQGALFASLVTARGPIVAPRNTPTVPILLQPDPGELRKCSEFLDSGEWAIQDSNLGPLPYQRSPWAKQAVATGHESPQKSCKSGPTSIVGRNRPDPRELILVDAEWTCCAEAGRVRSGGMPDAG
jgi:hypothetical protein